ncbi:MAG: 4Fe-4S dicluster domain-containing protein [Planctomycetota bacterium]
MMSDILDDPNAESKPAVWQSLREFDGSLDRAAADADSDQDVANFVGREFPTDDFDQLNEVDRRRFFQILGASAALAGASSCRWEREEILPYAVRPEETVPGKPKYYASVLDLAGAARPVTVTSYDGRPVKVEPNTLVGQGTDVYSQAEVLGFYDPDRSQGVLKRTEQGFFNGASYGDAIAALKEAAAAGGMAVLASTHSSPTLARLGGDLAASGARWVWWSPVGRDSERAGAELAFGRPVRTHYDLERADVLLSLDSDFLSGHPDELRMSAEFAARREPELGDMCRLYAVESRFTTTGVASDHRLPVKSSDAGAILQLVEAALGMGTTGPRALALAENEKVAAFVRALAADLKGAKGRCVIIPGSNQPAAVHAHAHAVNAALGAVGTTVRYTEDPAGEVTDAGLASLVADMRSGAVKSLLVLGGNPAYDAPVDLDFSGAAENVMVFHHGLYRDETAAMSDWHMPAAHWLESWGDARSWDGSVHIAQPLIKPIAGGMSAIELCAALLGREGDARAEVRATFDAMGLAGNGEARFRQAIHDGVVDGTRMTALDLTVGSLPAIAEGSDGTEITFFPCPKVFDGRFANNGWLQELPDFTTKMTWDNAVLIGKKTADGMGVTTGDMVQVTLNGRTLEAAAFVAVGQAEDSVAISLGYGRRAAGLVAGSDKAEVSAAGFDAYALRGTDGMGIGTGVSIAKGSGDYTFATTQEHHLIDAIGMKGRRERLHKLAMEGTEEQWKEDPNFTEHVYHVPKLTSLFDQKVYDGTHQWGMTIDLSTCNGCNACVVACQSENNIPIVGKEQVKRGREMHWMRIDLYFQGDADEASTVDAVTQPINCLQCENAPCEQVCPVAATVHGEEGTNDMVYNRCIGTRYCGNNCPVKVRRFNYFHYTKYMDKPEHKRLQLAQNPNVTVRSRGVMEKCTYCMQRISEARITARNEDRKIRDGEVITACQAACASGAIHFGDLTDPESKVSKKQALGRDYSMLAELNIRPRTQYLARISNPNEGLAEAMPQGVKGREDYDPAIYGHGGHGGHGDSHHGSDDHGDSHHGEEEASHDDH